MKLICMGMEYPCVRAEKDEAAGTVTAYGETGSVVFRAVRVTDFSHYTLEEGEWSPSTPTRDQRLEALEQENGLLRAQIEAQSGQLDFYEDCIAEMAAVVYA